MPTAPTSTSEKPLASQEDAFIDPFYERIRRDPIPPDSGIHAVILAKSAEDSETARNIAVSLAKLTENSGRPFEVKVVHYGEIGLAEAMRQGHENAVHPLVLITTAIQPWTTEHLDPMLKAIDVCDHVFGDRRSPLLTRLRNWIARTPWKLLFSIPGLDVDTPCRLHRLAAIRSIPLQSRSRFVNVELLVKATYLTQVVGNVRVPDLKAAAIPLNRSDARLVFWRPTLPVSESYSKS